MILGFLSLLLTFGQSYIVRICIPTDVADKLLSCLFVGTDKESSSEEEHSRKLLSNEHIYLSALTNVRREIINHLYLSMDCTPVTHSHILLSSPSCILQCCNNASWETKDS
ncbi:hypothetical protein PHAVU_003G221250 [Phaseolus vulgaris]